MSSTLELRPCSRILLVGDSLTEGSFDQNGWGLQLSRRYARRADVLNRGIGGYNSRWMLKVLRDNLLPEFGAQPGATAEPRMSFAVLFLGANDAASRETNSFQHVPVHDYGENLYRLGKGLLEMAKEGIVLVTPTPVVAEMWLACRKRRTVAGQPMPEKSDRDTETVRQYADMVFKVQERLAGEFAGENKTVALYDAFKAFTCAPDMERLFYDGLHFASPGHELFLDGLWSTLDSVNWAVRPGPAYEDFPFLSTYANGDSYCPILSFSAPSPMYEAPEEFQEYFSSI